MAAITLPLLLLLLLLALSAPAALCHTPILGQLSSSDFTGFMTLLEHADVIPEIEAAVKAGKGLTILAPTDEALMHHTSPTLLAFLKLGENKAQLRQVLLAHIVTQRLTPFHWEGAHPTLQGTPLALSMDSQAFYAGGVPLTQYNALVSGEASVHSLSTLIVPPALAASAKSAIAEAAEARRSLVVSDAALAPGPDVYAGNGRPAPENGPPQELGAAAGAVASLLSLAAAVGATIFL